MNHRWLWASLVLSMLLASITHAARWAPINPAEAKALAEAQAGQWLRNARERAVLPGAGPDGLARVRTQAALTEPSAVALRDELLKQAQQVLDRPIAPYRTPEEVTAATGQTLFDTRQELWMRRVGDELVLLSMAAVIRPDDEALRRRIHDHALAVCRYPQWGVRERNQDLAAGHVARGLAVAWSWNRGLWDEADAAFIRDTVRERVNMLCTVMSGGIYWAGAYQENHNHVGGAAVGFCGAAFLADLPDEAPLWLATAQLNFEAVARHANADGSSPEGVSYWSYSAGYILQYIEGVRGIIDVEPFYAGDWLRNMVGYRLHASTPGLGGTLPWGDAVARDYYGPHHILHRLAAEYRDPSAQYLAANLSFAPQGPEVIAWNWLWHDPSVPAKPPESLDAHTPVADLVDSRSGWGAGDYLLAIKSGYTNRNHSHLDAGAIAFAFGGEWLLPASGYGRGSGDREFWDSGRGRWNYFSNATESHTTLLVNGRNQRFDSEARGTVTRFASAPRSLWTEVDLREAYEGVDAAWRRVFHRRGEYVLVLDDVVLKEAGRVEWLLQVPPSAEVGGTQAHIEGVAGSLDVRVIEPATALAARTPLIPKMDVPATRLKSYATQIEGSTAEFRTLLVPRFGGSLESLPTVKRGEGDRYKIEGNGWSDKLVFSDTGAVLKTDSSGVSASARLLVVRTESKQVVDVQAVAAVALALPFGSLAFEAGTPAAVAATRIHENLWVIDSDRAGTWSKKPDAAWRLSAGGKDAATVPAGRSLLMRGQASSADYERWQAEQVAVRTQPSLPVRENTGNLPPAPAASRVAVEAEAFSAQVTGRVDIVDKPGNRGRSLRGFGNDSSFHTLAWKVKVPVAGTYRLRLRYCTPVADTRVSLLVDGAAPGKNALDIPLPPTGGWSVDNDDWRDVVLRGTDGTAVLLPLSAGEHELRLTRPSSAINLDAFELIGGTE
jgi:hypothetical protein